MAPGINMRVSTQSHTHLVRRGGEIFKDNALRVFTIGDIMATSAFISSTYATIVSGAVVLIIIFRSNALETTTIVNKMPLAAALIVFLINAISFAAMTVQYELDQFRLISTTNWSLDVIARSILLWFTSARLRAVWPRNVWILRATVALQLLQIGAVSLAIFASLSRSIILMSPEYLKFVTAYLLLDLATLALDFAALVRLWSLRQIAIQSNMASVNMSAYRRAVTCVLLMIALPILATALVSYNVTGSWAYYAMLLAFRILVTDLFSSALRDSLFEKIATKKTTTASISLG
nr:hypothetical protein HK105_002207 [Polyrhizophydium stewartii]